MPSTVSAIIDYLTKGKGFWVKEDFSILNRFRDDLIAMPSDAFLVYFLGVKRLVTAKVRAKLLFWFMTGIIEEEDIIRYIKQMAKLNRPGKEVEIECLQIGFEGDMICIYTQDGLLSRVRIERPDLEDPRRFWSSIDKVVSQIWNWTCEEEIEDD